MKNKSFKNEENVIYEKLNIESLNCYVAFYIKNKNMRIILLKCIYLNLTSYILLMCNTKEHVYNFCFFN